MKDKVTRKDNTVKITAGSDWQPFIQGKTLIELTNTGNGYIAKLPALTSSQKDTYVCLDYSHAALLVGLEKQLNEVAAYDQQALELCETCGWKAIIPGEPCLVCERNARMLKPESPRKPCDRHPAAPHGVDIEASFRAGHKVCQCESWTPGDAS